jgi:hypothetical protein
MAVAGNLPMLDSIALPQCSPEGMIRVRESDLCFVGAELVGNPYRQWLVPYSPGNHC